MSSTEQKNVTQPFISSCYTFGILPTILTGAFDNFPLDTHRKPFANLGDTPNLGRRLREAEDPVQLCRNLLPATDSAPVSSRVAPLLLKLCSESTTYFGNQAVLRLAEGIVSKRWGLSFTESGAVRHAERHAGKICSMLAPGAYGSSTRTEANVRELGKGFESSHLRAASDVFDHISKGYRFHKYDSKVRYWAINSRKHSGFRARYSTNRSAINDYLAYDSTAILDCPAPPTVQHKWFKSAKYGNYQVDVFHYGSTIFIRIRPKQVTSKSTSKRRINLLTTISQRTKKRQASIASRPLGGSELYVLSSRDLEDTAYLIRAQYQMRLYMNRRLHDVRGGTSRLLLRQLQSTFLTHYMRVFRSCGIDFNMRNKLGVYFDVLQWRYLAWKSGDLFYSHSDIMARKLDSKGLTTLPPQESILQSLKQTKIDIAVDLLGVYKASIYPEVDPFKVVADQYELHSSRFRTEWEPDSKEAERFEDTRSYMWFLGIRVLRDRFGIWPGKVRRGVEIKEWHQRYKVDGLPSEHWREACDVDLTGTVSIADITDEQYFKQQDSACGPPDPEAYKSFDTLRKAPRRHKRKLLYAIQEPTLPSLPAAVEHLNNLGRILPRGYISAIKHELPFSVDIVTGSRCERHKDAPRPFYAASSPWGCILSYFDGITRDFLNNVPQSMLGKSTRQKFMDLQSLTREERLGEYTFFMSDDKAKYSPHMDPSSQQLPAEFFAELFDLPGLKAFGPIMYHCDLYYRVHGHLVSYNSNGTDREGMRGASNTWLEIVAQGLSTRLCRERGLLRGKSAFLSFIDDGLRRFSVELKNRNKTQCWSAARAIIEDVIFGLKVLGRELSWDKTFISQDMFIILNELVVDKSFISSGLKSFVTAGDLEVKEVMSAADYEQLFFGKMRGAHGVGTPIDLCHYIYVYDTLMSHYKMGVNLQNNKLVSNLDYRLFCVTPMAYGGGGLRSPIQMSCNEVGTATKEGIGNLLKLGHEFPILMACVGALLNQQLETLSPIDFMREPAQFHVTGPRIRTQRMAAEVRKHLYGTAGNALCAQYLEQDRVGLKLLEQFGSLMMLTGDVGAEEIRLMYASTPVAFIDEFIQKLASSATIANLLDRRIIGVIRGQVRRDLKVAVEYFDNRCAASGLIKHLKILPAHAAMMTDLL